MSSSWRILCEEVVERTKHSARFIVYLCAGTVANSGEYIPLGVVYSVWYCDSLLAGLFGARTSVGARDFSLFHIPSDWLGVPPCFLCNRYRGWSGRSVALTTRPPYLHGKLQSHLFSCGVQEFCITCLVGHYREAEWKWKSKTRGSKRMDKGAKAKSEIQAQAAKRNKLDHSASLGENSRLAPLRKYEENL